MASSEDSSLFDASEAATAGSKKSSHTLKYPFALWFSHRAPGGRRSTSTYEDNVEKIASFSTVEEFWQYYGHMIKPDDLPASSDINLFKDGVKPIWEDEQNRHGGKWILRLRKGLASRYWENLILALLGDQFDVGDDICGAVVSVRFQEDIISIWNKTADNQDLTFKIRDTMKKVLSLPNTVYLEYKKHDVSLKDNSSFRNTDVFR